MSPLACDVLDLGGADAAQVRARGVVGIADRYRHRAEAARSVSGALAALGAGMLLSEVMGASDDADLKVGAHGKPQLASGHGHFSLAHAGQLVVLAHGQVRVGVDVEPLGVHSRLVLQGALVRALGDTARAAGGRRLLELDADELTDQWTRVEAAVKLDGRGLDLDVRSAPEVLRVPCATGRIAGHAVAIACEVETTVALRCHRLTSDARLVPWVPDDALWPGRATVAP